MIERLVDSILARTLPPGVAGEDIRNDLKREFDDRRERHRHGSHRLWYLWEAMKLGASFLWFRSMDRGFSNKGEESGPHSGSGLPGSVGQDLRFAARTLRRRWRFSLVAVLTLGLGIGSATAMFSVVDGVLLRSVPFREPGRLVDIWLAVEWARDLPGASGEMWDRIPLSLDEFRSLEADANTLEGVGAHTAWEATLTGQGPASRVTMGRGSASLTNVLGIQPVLGRWFLPGEEGVGEDPTAPVAVISHDLWANRLGSDPEVLGKTLVLNGSTRTIVGVLPESFRIRHLGRNSSDGDIRGIRDVWIPVGGPGQSNNHNLEAIGRLAPGATVENAAMEVGGILSMTTEQVRSSTGGGAEWRIVPRGVDETLGLESPLVFLLGATAILLLISCANVATLSLGELHGRIPELSTRAALGAGRGRVFRQLLTESLLLGLLGTAVGAVLAVSGTRGLVAVAPPLPRIETIGVNLRVLGFAALLGTLAGVLCGTLPALVSARRATLLSGLGRRAASARRGPFERWFAAPQIALTVVLLVAGGLLGQSLHRLLRVDPGFDAEGLATVQIVLPTEGYEGREDILAVYDDLVAGIREIPGVTQVSAATKLPFPGLSDVVIFENPGGIEGEGGSISAQQVFVLPGYHETMGIPLLDGEDLEGIRVGAAPRGMLITENMARRYWPQDSPLGVNLDSEVVRGIVRDVKRNSLRVEADPVVYMSLLDRPSRQINIIARTRGDATTLAGRMREAIQKYDEGIPIRRVVSMPDLIADSAAPERYRAFLMGVFAALATLLAGVGVFGVSARGVARRRKELAVRICLGAEEQKLMGRVVRDGLLTGAPATLVGLIAAAWTGQLLSSLLFGVEPADPLTFGAVASFLSLVIMTASYLPARTIAQSDPARVLRAEE